MGGGEAGEELSFETVLDQASSGLGERMREVIRDEDAWARLWESIQGGVTPRPPLPTVDFSRHMLIAVATGARSTGGFGIAVKSVATRGDRLEVRVVETCPPPGAMVIMALTQPVAVVRLEKLALFPTFQEEKGSSCP
jgi:hypothetical protein